MLPTRSAKRPPHPPPRRKRVALTSINDALQDFNQAVKENTPPPDAAAADDDDRLIEYLTKKLGVHTDKRKERSILRSVTRQEFGGDDELLTILDHVLPDTKDDDATGEEEEESDEEPSTSAPEESDQESEDVDEEDVDEEGVEEESDGVDEERESEEVSEKKPTPAPVGVWKPRSRGSGGSSSPEDLLKEVEIAVRGAFNRVGEGNVELTSDELVKKIVEAKDKLQLSLLDSPEVERVVGEFVGRVCCRCAEEALSFLHIKVALALTAPQTALLCSVSSRVSSRVMIEYVTRLVHQFKTAFEDYMRTDDQSKKEDARQSVHVMALLTYFGFLDVDLLVEFITYIGNGDTHGQVRLEMLALVFRICSADLKANYTPQFQQIESVIRLLIQKVEAGTESPASMHLEWIKHELVNVGKHRKAPMYEKILFLKNWLRKHRGGVLNVLDPKVYLEKMLTGQVPADSQASVAPAMSNGPKTESEEDNKLRTLAKRNGIKAPLQQEIFVGMARAKSVSEAMTSVLKAVTSVKNVEPAIAVILHCALKEKTFNPYYTTLITRLCRMPDEQWRKRFAKALKRGMFLLVAVENSEHKDRLKELLERFHADEVLDDKDYESFTSKRIFQ